MLAPFVLIRGSIYDAPNDAVGRSNKIREIQLTEMFAEMGAEVVFVD